MKRSTQLLLLAALVAVVLTTLAAPAAAGRNPDIDFNKTVGTTPGVCATESEITVPAGTTVYYCYRFREIPFRFPIPRGYYFNGAYNFTLDDSELGALLEGTNQSYGSPVEYIQEADIFVDTFNIAEFNRTLDVRRIGGLIPIGSRGGYSFSRLFYDNATVLIENETPGGGGFEYDAEIPTLSEVSMFVFGGLLLIGAAITFRRSAS